MGWTSYHAGHYRNGKVDVLAEVVQEVATSESDKSKWEVLKSAQYGSTVYLAVRYTNKETQESKVFGEVVLTSTSNGEYYNFSYKDMDETCGPGYFDCPAGILDLLSPTDSKWANEWRTECRKRIAAKRDRKKDPNSLNNLPVGAVIRFNHWDGEVRYLTKYQLLNGRSRWVCGRYYYPVKLIERYGYEVYSTPETEPV